MDDTDSSYDQEKIQAQLGFSRCWNKKVFFLCSVIVLSLICDLISIFCKVLHFFRDFQT